MEVHGFELLLHTRWASLELVKERLGKLDLECHLWHSPKRQICYVGRKA